MKPSYYNYIIENKNGTGDALYYNMRTGSLAHVKEKNHTEFLQFVESGIKISDKQFWEDLKYCGFLIEDDFDEKKDIKIRMLSSRYDTSVLSLTITPTMACNFRCVYCFESGHYSSGRMSEETEDDICKMVEQEAAHLEKLVITWYGGEPLLAIEPIEELTSKFKEICKQFNIEYSASIITNGYLLTESICDRLLELDITDAQITLDGNAKIHNSRRPLANGGNTYDTIINNLEKNHGKIGIAIRINVDRENEKDVQSVVDELKKRGIYEDVFCYLGLVTSTNGTCSNCTCMSSERYSEFNLDFWLKNNMPLESLYPKPMGNYCGADYAQGYVLDAQGNIYKCWSDVGVMEQRIGTAHDWNETNKKSTINEVQSQSVFEKYMLYDPTEDPVCSKCKFMPICFGGCPHSRIENNQLCEQYRYNVGEFMQAYADAVLKEERGEDYANSGTTCS